MSSQHGEHPVVAVLTHELDEEAAHPEHDLLVGDPEHLGRRRSLTEKLNGRSRSWKGIMLEKLERAELKVERVRA